MGTSYTNRHGRRPTRGLRPWLLIPKLISVAIFLGSLAAVCFIWFAGDWEDVDNERRLWTVNLIGQITRFLLVPALLLAIAFGVGLLLQHPGTFLRLRWVRVKLACLLVAIPASHFYLSSRLALLRGDTNDTTAATGFGRGLLVSCLVFIAIAALARLKPRLGQNYARAFAPRAGASDQNVADDVPADVG